MTGVSISIITFLSAFIGAIAGAVAKQIFAHLKDKSDTRKFTHQTYQDIIIESIRELRAISCEYWAEPDCSNSITIESRIMGQIEFLQEMIGGLFEETTEVKRQCDTRLHALRKSITSGDFQVRERASFPEKSGDIEIAAGRLESYVRLEKAKFRTPWV